MVKSIVPETPLQFGVAERLSQAFKARSMGIRVEAPKMVWEDSVSTAYLIYRIPYIPIGLRILEEEWQRKDTSLTHLKVFGCDSFVKVKYVCGEVMKCTFIGSGSDEVRCNTKSHQVIQSRDITFMDLIYGARAQVGAQIQVRGPKTVGASRIVENKMMKTLKTEHSPMREASRLYKYEDPPESPGLQLPAGKKASQRLWMFKVKEEQNSSEKVQGLISG
ncbi:hypothetical protein Tco_0196426 [Tanacetum coccineum]